MPDPASQANELRLLEQKRLRNGLSPEEEVRRASLSTAAPAPAVRGFDVKAAAAEVRALVESEAPPQPVAAPAPPRPRAPEFVPAAPSAPRERPLEPFFPSGNPAAKHYPALASEQVAPAANVDTWLAAIPDQPSVTADLPQNADAAPAAPVYDAAAYGLDPNDPTAAAWAAWYAEQGWDPATAYAYAQQMNAGSEPTEEAVDTAAPVLGAGGEDAVDAVDHEPDACGLLSDPGAGELPSSERDAELELTSAAPTDDGPDALDPCAAVSELVAYEAPVASSEPFAGDHASSLGDDVLLPAPAVPEEADPELPPLELKSLDEPAAEVAHAGELGADGVIDLGPPFESGSRPEGGTAPEPPSLPLEHVHLDPLASDWAIHAVPADDEPVDMTAFDAAPAAAPPSESRREAEHTAMWTIGAASSQEPEESDLLAASGSAIAGARADIPLEPLEPEPFEIEPLEIEEADILEVGEDVVAATGVADAAPPAPAVLSPPLPQLAEAAMLAAGDMGPVRDEDEETAEIGLSSRELTSTFDAALPPEPDTLESIWSAPPEPAKVPPRASCVSGTHRVVVHTADGQVKRGTVTDVELESGEVFLAGQGGGAAEPVPVGEIKAIFFMLPPGEQPAGPEGKKVRVTFRDGRQVAGFSSDYAPERPGFFMVPSDTRTHTARIWVYRSAVRQVSVY